MSSLKKRFQTLLLTLAMTVFVTVGMTAMAELTVQATDQDIVVLYTNDVHCGVDDNIGYAGLALYKKEMEAQTPYVALVDAGDAVQGAPIGTLSDGGYIIDIMNYVGYDFAIPGNHEFDYGMPRFLELSGKLNCGYYSCNFMNLTSGTPVFAPYKIVTYGDTQVAFVGVSTPESFTKSTPAYFQDGNGNYLYGFCEDESGQALYNQVQAAVDGAKSQGAEFVILVGHLGNEGVSGQWTSQQIVKNTNGVDAVIDGHSHETYDKTCRNKDGEEVVVTQTGTKLKNIRKMTIKPDGTITTEMVTEVPGGAMATEDGKFVDAATDAYIKKIQAQYSESLKTVLGHTEVELTVKDPETGGFLHVSGITYTINTSVPSNVKLDERGNFKNVSGVYRVGDILVNGEPLDVNKTYTVASHNYMLKSGGDGMAMFAGSKVVKDDVMVDVDVLSSYISEKLGGNVGADYGNPKGQGRIIIK